MGFWSFSFKGNPFKRYYCAHCGEKLIREKVSRAITARTTYHEFFDTSVNGTHFAVTDEPDIFDVKWRFCCPACRRRYSVQEQGVNGFAQKILKKKKLTRREIERHRPIAERSEYHRKNRFDAFSLLFGILVLLYTSAKNGVQWSEPLDIVFPVAAILCMLFPLLRRCLSKKERERTDERSARISIFEDAQADAYGTAEELHRKGSCYCFYCMENIDPKEIVQYEDNGATAVCPRCFKITLLPEAPHREGDTELLEDLKHYWYWY